MEVSTREVTWTCGCESEHRPTIGRAWCFACTEWCYPHALCVRGEDLVFRALLERWVAWVERAGVGDRWADLLKDTKEALGDG